MKALFLAAANILVFVSLSISVAGAQPGSLDLTFNPGTGANDEVYCFALQTNGQMIVVGDFNTINGQTNHHVVRLNNDGSADSSFRIGEGPVGGGVRCVALQNDGKAVIGGSFSSVNSLARYYVARLRTDGSLDTSFVPATGFTGPEGQVKAVTIQTDGKILIAGFFNINGSARIIARLDSDGSLDTGFNIGSGPNAAVSALAIQTNGQILIGGYFTAVNGTNRNYLARLNTDGTLDPGFNPDPMNGPVTSIVSMTNNQVMAGGDFSTINGYTRQGLARFNYDGSLDTQFSRPLLPGAQGVYFLVQQPDGKFLFSGNYGASLKRFNPDGTDDPNFNMGTGPSSGLGPYCRFTLQPDGKILIGGGFLSFNGTNINRIARLNGDSPASTNLNLLSPQLYFGMNLSGVVSNIYRIEYTSQFDTPSLWTPLFNVTLQNNPQFILDPDPAAGQRFYRAVELP